MSNLATTSTSNTPIRWSWDEQERPTLQPLWSLVDGEPVVLPVHRPGGRPDPRRVDQPGAFCHRDQRADVVEDVDEQENKDDLDQAKTMLAAEAQRAGVTEYVTKPVNVPGFLALIDRLLDAQERVDNLPLPANVRDWLQAYADAHYQPEVKKRKRPASFQAPDQR